MNASVARCGQPRLIVITGQDLRPNATGTPNRHPGRRHQIAAVGPGFISAVLRPCVPQMAVRLGTKATPEVTRSMNEKAADTPIKVFLLDDHEIVRRGVKELLEGEPDISVIGEAGTAASALARIPALKPNVAVLDVRLPDGDGVSVCRDIRSRMPEVACLMLTSFGDDEALFDAIMAGAAGYVLKQIRGTDLVGAVRTIAAGQSLLDPAAAARVMARMRDESLRSDPLAALTGQERKILELIGEGLTNRQIGERLFLAEKTVKNYVSALFAKLGMERRTQAAAYAARIFEDDDHHDHRASGG
jgi:two-component system, NarL family, response regulator DevR